ncbi:hypothetical protein FHS91_002584 [Sphingobium xanthum]
MRQKIRDSLGRKPHASDDGDHSVTPRNDPQRLPQNTIFDAVLYDADRRVAQFGQVLLLPMLDPLLHHANRMTIGSKSSASQSCFLAIFVLHPQPFEVCCVSDQLSEGKAKRDNCFISVAVSVPNDIVKHLNVGG